VSFATTHYPGAGTPGQYASYAEENLILAYQPCCSYTSRVTQGLLAPRCSSRPRPPARGGGGVAVEGTLGRCGAESPVEVAGAAAQVGGGSVDSVRPLPLRKGS
jgi:hypothetical protein